MFVQISAKDLIEIAETIEQLNITKLAMAAEGSPHYYLSALEKEQPFKKDMPQYVYRQRKYKTLKK